MDAYVDFLVGFRERALALQANDRGYSVVGMMIHGIRVERVLDKEKQYRPLPLSGRG